MESGELGIFVDIWERDADPVEDLEAMLFEHLLNQGHNIIIIGCGTTIRGRCEISCEKPEYRDETDCIDESVLGINISEHNRRMREHLEYLKEIDLKYDYEDVVIEPRAKFDHYRDKAVYRAKNEVIKRTIIPRRKRIRIHGRKK